MGFIGIGMHLGNLPRLSNAHTRSISAENITGAKGAGAKAEPHQPFSERPGLDVFEVV